MTRSHQMASKHNLPQEAPHTFAKAIMQLDNLRSCRKVELAVFRQNLALYMWTSRAWRELPNE